MRVNAFRHSPAHLPLHVWKARGRLWLCSQHSLKQLQSQWRPPAFSQQPEWIAPDVSRQGCDASVSALFVLRKGICAFRGRRRSWTWGRIHRSQVGHHYIHHRYHRKVYTLLFMLSMMKARGRRRQAEKVKRSPASSSHALAFTFCAAARGEMSAPAAERQRKIAPKHLTSKLVTFDFCYSARCHAELKTTGETKYWSDEENEVYCTCSRMTMSVITT